MRKAFCGAVHWADYLTWINWRTGRPTRLKIQEDLLRPWFEDGFPLVVELGGAAMGP